MEESSERRVVFRVQHHAHLDVLADFAQHAQGVEAAQMRTEDQHALFLCPLRAQRIETVHLDVETFEALGEQEQAIQQDGREIVELLADILQRRLPAKYSLQIITRGPSLRPTTENEEGGD